MPTDDDLALLLRLNKSWYDGIPADELYDITRAWWVMSAANAERVVRVLAVAGGVVREVYEPTEWQHSPIEGLENRIGFNGTVASDRDRVPRPERRAPLSSRIGEPRALPPARRPRHP